MKRMFHPWENWLYRRFNPKIEGFYPLVEISGKGGKWFASLYCCPSDPLKNPLIEKPNPKKKQQSPYPEKKLIPNPMHPELFGRKTNRSDLLEENQIRIYENRKIHIRRRTENLKFVPIDQTFTLLTITQSFWKPRTLKFGAFIITAECGLLGKWCFFRNCILLP